MPTRPARHLAPGSRPPALERRETRRAHDARRRADQPWRAWYSLKAWLVARAAQLARQPLCERCLGRGDVEPATVVHHRRPHRGDWRLFIDPANHESACKPCHDGEIQREERAAERWGWGGPESPPALGS